MSELMVLLQALLLIAGWLLFLRAQTELRAQAARQSLTGELEELRQTVDALLQKLAEEAAQAEARIEARLRELEQRSTGVSPVQPDIHASSGDALERDAQATMSDALERDAQAPIREHSPLERDAQATMSDMLGRGRPSHNASETFTPDSGYNLSASETSPYGAVAILAEQGLSVPEIARQTGYAQGEVELILSLTRRNTEENE